MPLEPTATLSNGVTVPRLGLGTWLIDDGDVADVVRTAVELGYRHVDTAQAYGNEVGVGEGVRTSGVPRDELFVTTKLAAEIKSHDEAIEAIDGSLEALGLDHVDLLLIHSPQPWADFGGDDRFVEGNREAWRALERALDVGKARSIGVSNFRADDLDAILATCDVAPMVDQVLAHVAGTPTELVERCRADGIVVEAYAPLGHGELLDHPPLVEMAERYGVSVPQLAIRYDLQLGFVTIAKSVDRDHLRTNLDVGFEIADDDLAALRGLDPIDDDGDAGRFPVFGG